MDNIFSQEICQFLGKFHIKHDLFQLIEKDMDEKFSYYEISYEENFYVISVYLAENQLNFWQEEIQNFLRKLDISLALDFFVKPIIDKDWVTEVGNSYEPIETDLFFVKSSFYKGQNISKKILLEIDPQRAFGTGEHETTRSCLNLLAHIAENRNIDNILDLGTGSGILAIASKKIWKNSKIIGADIDDVSIDIAKRNAEINQSSDVIFLVSDGFNHSKISSNKVFNLIIVNILANFLVKIAENIRDSLHEDGYCILSGFLVNQEESIIAKYESLNFFVAKRVILNNWVSLIMRKKSPDNQ